MGEFKSCTRQNSVMIAHIPNHSTSPLPTHGWSCFIYIPIQTFSPIKFWSQFHFIRKYFRKIRSYLWIRKPLLLLPVLSDGDNRKLGGCYLESILFRLLWGTYLSTLSMCPISGTQLLLAGRKNDSAHASFSQPQPSLGLWQNQQGPECFSSAVSFCLFCSPRYISVMDFLFNPLWSESLLCTISVFDLLRLIYAPESWFVLVNVSSDFCRCSTSVN